MFGVVVIAKGRFQIKVRMRRVTTVSTNSTTAGGSTNAGGRVRSGGHVVVDYGVIGNGVVASVG